MRAPLALLIGLFGTASAAHAQKAAFTGLGELAGGAASSEARAVSPDGRYVVGSSESGIGGTTAFRWDRETALMELLTDLPGGAYFCVANGVSQTGVPVGRGSILGGFRAVYWAATNATALGTTGANSSTALGVSADGTAITGFSATTDGFQAARWVNAGAIELLGDLAGGAVNSRANAASEDGGVVVGQGASAAGRVAARWAGGAPTPLGGTGDLPGGAVAGEAYGVSADGAVAVGKSLSALGDEAFRWTLAGDAMVGLGDLAGGAFYSAAWAVSADGRVIVGESTSGAGTEAFYWTEKGGMRPLKRVLEDDFRLDLTGWTLTAAMGISASGTVVVGRGVNARGEPEAWRAALPDSAIIVNSAGDEPDANATDDACDVDAAKRGAQCTLRAAIEVANRRAGRDSVAFAIEGEGVPVVAPAAALPGITGPLVIDATTQVGGTVRLSGAALGVVDGLVASGTDRVTVRGLAVTGFGRWGLRFDGGTGHRVERSAIGFLPKGGAPTPNVGGGILVENGARDVTIGGRTAAAENRIYGGVLIQGAATRGVRVLRNEMEVAPVRLGAGTTRVPLDLADSGPTCAPWTQVAGDAPNRNMPAPRLFAIEPGTVSGRTRPGATVVVYRAAEVGTERGRYWARRVLPVGVATADGKGAFSVGLDAPLAVGAFVTATATDADGNTSELAQLRRPVIFLPGVGGSWLLGADRTTLWLPITFTDEQTNLRLVRLAMNTDGTQAEAITTDGMLESVSGKSLPYGPVMIALQEAGYPGEEHNGNRATNDLWRFANDWRLSTAVLAGDLKTLIGELTGGAPDVARACEVDLVAHSNGGIIASMLVLGSPAEAADHVHRLLTSGTPYLGAVQPFASHTKGDVFGIEESLSLDLDWGRMIAWVGNVPAAYGLTPSRRYWEAVKPASLSHSHGYVLQNLYGLPLRTFDLTETFVTAPKTGLRAEPLGLERNAAVWKNQQTAVQRVVGDWTSFEGPPHVFRHAGLLPASTATGWRLGPGNDEIAVGGTVRSEAGDTDRHRGFRERIQPVLGWGDGTVPLVSATLGWDPRVGAKDFSGVDGPWIEPFEFYPCKHVDLVGPTCLAALDGQPALERIVEVLKGGYAVGPPPDARARRGEAAQARSAEGPGRDVLYVSATAPVRVHIDDAAGRHTGPASDAQPGRIAYEVPGVGYWPTDRGATVSVPTGVAYTVRVESPGATNVRVVRLLADGDDAARRNALFPDQTLAARGALRLGLAAAGTPADAPLAVDADGDGVFERTLAPSAVLNSTSGAPAVPTPEPSAVEAATPVGVNAAAVVVLPDVGAAGWRWELAEASEWITPSATSGAVPGAVTLAFASAGLPTGLHRATVQFTLRNGAYAVAVPVPVRLSVGAGSVGVEGAPEGPPTATALHAPAPNPASGRATVRYEIAEAGRVQLAVYDLLGREVARLADGEAVPGRYDAAFDTGRLPAGVYALRLVVNGTLRTARMTVVR